MAKSFASQLIAPLRKKWSDEALARSGKAFGATIEPVDLPGTDQPSGELESYFDAHLEGPGIWKWRHYFPIYERHLRRFVGTDIHVVEIGVFSGGSLGMWHSYFGERAQIHGVDIDERCRSYEGPGRSVHIGDQADPVFWQKFLEEVPIIDVVLDDGGHQARQQIATLESLLPHIRPGGVYLCEDIHSKHHGFHSYLAGLARNLHAMGADVALDGSFAATGFQQRIESIHSYPFVAVIEMRGAAVSHLVAPKHGTQWQPIYERERFPT